MTRWLYPTACLVLIGTSVHAKQAELPSALTCDFRSVSATKLEGEKIQPQDLRVVSYPISIVKIDMAKKTAQMIGNAEASHLSVFHVGNWLHFLELIPSGDISVTSVWISA